MLVGHGILPMRGRVAYANPAIGGPLNPLASALHKCGRAADINSEFSRGVESQDEPKANTSQKPRRPKSQDAPKAKTRQNAWVTIRRAGSGWKALAPCANAVRRYLPLR